MKRQDASTGQIVEDGATPAPVKTDDANPTMHVKVYSPFRIYFDDVANSISAMNATGQFDILPRHHNFMTLLNPCEMVLRTPGGEQRIRIAQGVMHVKADQVIVFLDV